MPRRWTAPPLLVVVGVLALAAGCSSSGGGGDAGAPAADGRSGDDAVALAAVTDRVEVEAGQEATVDVVANDRGRDVRLTRVVGLPAKGTATVADGELRYVPEAGSTGVETVTYEVADDAGETATGTVELDVGDTTGAAETAIAWTACTFPDEDPASRAATEQRFAANRCATVDVPVDHDAPDGDTLELFLTERPAPADDPIGPLFVNQGGPGAEAAEYSTTLAPNPDLDRFDIVGMDPRGVGRSTHPSCGDDLVLDWGTGTIPAAGDPPTDFEQAARAVADACAADPHLAHLSSNETARDMDRVREMLGADQLTYFGKSYGSDLGTAYASLFPEHLRAAVLDGASDVSLDPVDFVAQQAQAGLDHLDRYLEHCRVDGCAWADGQDPAEAWTALRARLDASPLTDPETGEQVTGDTLRDWYHQEAPMVPFDELDETLDQLVLEGDPDVVRAEDFDDLALATAFFSVTCADLPVDDYRAAVARLTEQVPDPPTDSLVTLAACAAWPVQDPIAVSAPTGAGPILVVGTTGDVPTPYVSSRGLADVLGAGFLTWDAESHTAYFFSECVAEQADRVLVDLRLPAEGAPCADPLGWWLTGSAPRSPVEVPAA